MPAFLRSIRAAVFRPRWGVLLAAALLHLLALEWAADKLPTLALPEHEDAPVVAHLLTPPAPADAVARPPAPAVRPAAHPHPHRRPRPQPHSAVAPPAPASLPAVEQVADAPAPLPAFPPDALAENAGPAPAPAPEAAPAAKAPDASRYLVDPPPSARLDYEVQALREGHTFYGHGTLDWRTDGSSYAVDGEAGLMFFTVLSFRSSGMLDDSGVAPVLYTEKRFRRPATNTHFHRERNTISFSSSTASYPRRGGEQDRASLVWQLSGIGRGSAERFAPGAEIDLFVAGVRDAETWSMRVAGEEEIDVGGGKMLAWHVVRQPRPGSYEQKIDFWFAPQQGWYPVKLRYTETNGDYLDMSLSRLTPAAE